MQFNFGTLINSILVAMIIFYVYFYPKIKAAKGQDRRREAIPKNPDVKPGDGEACKENSGNIIKLQTKLKEICKDIEEIKQNNREDHKDMFDKIDKIKDKRR